ncbi:MAG: SET domain-containing protein-lysine N-methyltransferase [Geminicoccaceae bacterium]|nr:SET domain-containing protein-lysine N-methyltransferase [Geminicoccaceae bacterium]
MRIGRIEIRPAGAKGLGVFALEPIARGECFEPQPVFELDPEDVPRIEATRFRHHYFAHPERDGQGVIVLGWLTFVNHAVPPSLELDWQCDARVGWMVIPRARRDIAAGEELTIDYNCPLWFEPVP